MGYPIFFMLPDSNQLNAVRMSAAGEGSTEPLLNFIESVRMWAKIKIYAP